MSDPIVITERDLLIGADGIPLGGSKRPDLACPHCKGKGYVPGLHGWGTWTCLCAGPTDPAAVAYWRERVPLTCADCGQAIDTTGRREPPDGWQLEDGRTVCGDCVRADLRRIADLAQSLAREAKS